MPVTFDHNDQIILVSIYTYLQYKVYLLWNPDEIIHSARVVLVAIPI